MMTFYDTLMKNKYLKLLEDKKIKYWEFREESLDLNSVISWNDGIQDLITGHKKGYSYRVLYENGWGFVYSERDNHEETIKQAIKIAKSLNENTKEKVIVSHHKTIKDYKKSPMKINPKDISLEEKKNLCLNKSKELLKEDGVKSTKTIYHDFLKKKHFINSEDSDIKQELTRSYIATSVISGRGNQMESGTERKGYLRGYETVKDIDKMGQKALETSRLLLKAKTPKGGSFPVICDGSLTDVFIHEALGHASEADHFLNNDSCLKGKLNKKIGTEIVNVFDNAKKNLWGSYFYDDEGIPAQNTQLIKDGILTGLLTSRENASRLGLKLTGNGRAEDASSLPIVRMSNTHIEKGDHKFEEMLREIKDGVYLIGSRGGQVNTKKGNFAFSAEYGYKIKNGELSEPLKGVSLSGETLDTLRNITEISNSYQEGSPGMCGKLGQSVPVVGNCPRIRLKKALVGGK
jgi:TldD protein